MDYLYLKYIDYKTNKKYIIGALYKKENKYYFKLVKDFYKKIEKIDFPINTIPFNDENKIYESEELFDIFKIRLPDISKYTENELSDLLKEYKQETYDEFEFLRITKGKLRIDNFIVEGEN